MQNNTQDIKNTRFRTILPFIVCALFMICGIVYAQKTEATQEAALSAQSSEIASLQNRLAVLEAAADDDTATAIYIASGLDTARQSNDDAIMDVFFAVAFTWSDYESYMSVRQTLMDNYGFTEEDDFISRFMPDVGTLTIDGNTINEIDLNGLNCEYVSMESNVIGIEGGTYSYFTLVTILSSDSIGATATDDMAVTYSVDSEGNFYDVMAYQLSAS